MSMKPRNRKRQTLRTRWQTTYHSCPLKGTRGNMLFDPTERNVNPFLFQTRIRTMKKLVLTLAIHDKDVTMAKAAQVGFIVRKGPAVPFEECSCAKAHRNDELHLHALRKQRLIITMPTNPRVPSPIKVQVRGSWHLLSTPWLHQGCDRPPHTGKQ